MEAFVKIPTQDGIRPFILYPWMHEVADPGNGGVQKRELMLKAREIGSSTFWVAEKLRKVLANPGANLLIAANKEDNAKNLIKYAREMVSNLPDKLGIRIERFNQSEVVINFGSLGTSLIKALPGTGAAGRSERSKYIVCTETGYWGDGGKINPEEYMMSVLGTLSGAEQDGEVVIESTAYTSADMFHDMWMADNNGYTKRFYGVWDNPSHTPQWYAQRRAEIPETFLFLRDYPETAEQAFTSAANTYFDADTILVGQTFVRPPLEVKEIGGGEGKDPGSIHYWQKALAGRTYAIGADCAEGKSSIRGKPDWSCAYVVDVRNNAVVAAVHCRLYDFDFAYALVALAKEYNNAFLAIERNAVGLAVIRTVQNLGYTNLYHHKRDVVGSMNTEQTPEVGFLTTRTTKTIMLSDLHRALKAGFTIPDGKFWDEAKNLGRDTLKAISGHDDRVVAMGISYQSAINYQRPLENTAAGGTTPFTRRAFRPSWKHLFSPPTKNRT